MKSQKSFPCSLKSLSDLREAVTAFCAKAGLDAVRTGELELAINEACTNIIEHGDLKESKTYSLSMEIKDKRLLAVIRDPGKPYDFHAARTVKDSHELKRKRPRSGMGVYIIRQLVDAVIYNRLAGKENELTLVKNL